MKTIVTITEIAFQLQTRCLVYEGSKSSSNLGVSATAWNDRDELSHLAYAPRPDAFPV